MTQAYNQYSQSLSKSPCLLLFILALFLSLSACQSFPRPKDYSESPERLHAILQKQAQIKSLTGELAVELWQDNQKLFFRQFFATQAPNFIRIDTISPFEQPIMTLVSNAEEIKRYEVEKKTIFVGKQSADHFSRLLSFNISAEALSAVIRGQVPRISQSGGLVDWDGELNAYILQLKKDDFIQTIKIHAITHHVIYLAQFENQKKTLEIELFNYHDQQAIPQTIQLKLPDQNLMMLIKLKDFEANVEFPEETFQLALPKMVNIERID